MLRDRERAGTELPRDDLRLRLAAAGLRHLAADDLALPREPAERDLERLLADVLLLIAISNNNK